MACFVWIAWKPVIYGMETTEARKGRRKRVKGLRLEYVDAGCVNEHFVESARENTRILGSLEMDGLESDFGGIPPFK